MAQHPCLKCSQQVKKNCKAIQCSFCEYWVHIECGDISDTLYKEMCKRADTHGHFWVCMACKATSFVFRKQIDKLTERIGNAEERITETKNDLEKAKEDTDLVKKRVSNLEKKSDEDSARTKDSVFEEISDRENRKLNLVFHNITESTSNVAEERKKFDSKAIQRIFDTVKVKKDVEGDTKFMTRLGSAKDRPESAAPRPLLIGFYNETDKNDVLKNAKLLKGSKYEEISIVPDLTKRQRDEEDKLRKEANRLNEDLPEEDALNWEWRLIGPRGSRKLQKVRIRKSLHQTERRQQTGAVSRGRQKRPRPTTEEEEEMGGVEEEMRASQSKKQHSA